MIINCSLTQTKKMKSKNNEEDEWIGNSKDPKKNVFQRIQTGIQRMNRGKAKGFFRQGGSKGDGKVKQGKRSSF
jgi:hypothetical protein